MFDFDAGKLLIIGVVALVVIGPKDLPRVLRQAGQLMGRVRRMAGEFQGQFMEAVKEADLQDLRAEVAKIQDTARLDVDFDPARDVRHELLTAVDGRGEPALMTSTAEGGAAAVPQASNSFPAMDVAPPPSIAPAGAPVAMSTTTRAEDGGSTTLALERPAEGLSGEGASRVADADTPRVPRRRIMITRHRSLVRPGSPRDRAPLPYRSRNILPARLETPQR